MDVTTITTALVDVGPRLVVAKRGGSFHVRGYIAGKTIVRRLGDRFRLRQNFDDVLAMIAGVSLWLVGILLALPVVFPSITPGKALTTLGLGSVAIGFAFKDTFENFLPCIRRRVLRDFMEDAGEKTFALTSALALIDRVALRVGSDEYAHENGSYCALTLRQRHVALSGI